ncbi:putative ankyrin repeat protein RBE_0921 [Watersipora subatra]|uniref:putative ankyrin repeat protein RBE_0921 n=1 Tax=Watersipora subatra TaxID=2589382 RepID=UPI00355B581A
MPTDYSYLKYTGYTEAVDQGNKVVTQIILNSLKKDEEKLLLLKTAKKRGETVLHRAVGKRDESLVRALLDTLPPALSKDCLLTAHFQGCCLLRKALQFPDTKMFRYILSLMSDNGADDGTKNVKKYVELLVRRDKDGNTILHIIAMKGNSQLLNHIIKQEQCSINRQRLIKVSDSYGCTLLHVAVENTDVDLIRCIFKRLKLKKWRFDLLYAVDKRAQTALHYAARTERIGNSNKEKSMLATMLQAVTSSQRVTLLQMEDMAKNTALQEAIRVNNTLGISTIVGSVGQVSLNMMLQPFRGNKEMLANVEEAVNQEMINASQPSSNMHYVKPFLVEDDSSSASIVVTSDDDSESEEFNEQVQESEPRISCRKDYFDFLKRFSLTRSDSIEATNLPNEHQLDELKVTEEKCLLTERSASAAVYDERWNLESELDHTLGSASSFRQLRPSDCVSLHYEDEHASSEHQSTLQTHEERSSIKSLVGPGDSRQRLLCVDAKSTDV